MAAGSAGRTGPAAAGGAAARHRDGCSPTADRSGRGRAGGRGSGQGDTGLGGAGQAGEDPCRTDPAGEDQAGEDPAGEDRRREEAPRRAEGRPGEGRQGRGREARRSAGRSREVGRAAGRRREGRSAERVQGQFVRLVERSSSNGSSGSAGSRRVRSSSSGSGSSSSGALSYSPPSNLSRGERVVAAAEAWLGTPYAWGGGTASGPSYGIHDYGTADYLRRLREDRLRLFGTGAVRLGPGRRVPAALLGLPVLLRPARSRRPTYNPEIWSSTPTTLRIRAPFTTSRSTPGTTRWSRRRNPAPT